MANKLEQTAKILTTLAEKYGVDFNPREETGDVWFLKRKTRDGREFTAAYIMTHDAHLRIAHGEEVEFDLDPLVTEPDRFVFRVTARKGNRKATSIGEALWTPAKNIKAASEKDKRPYTTNQLYVASMAEKRGMDRALRILLNLTGLYSEEEADDFKRGRQAAQPRTGSAPVQSPSRGPAPAPPPRGDRGGTPRGGPTGMGPLGGGERASVEELGGPRGLMMAVSAGYDPELDPFKFKYKGGKHAGLTFAHVYLNDQPRKGGKDYTTWMAEQQNPWDQGRDRPLTEFEVKMWQSHIWLLTRVDKASGEIIPLEKCTFPWKIEPAPPQVGPKTEGHNDPEWVQPPPQDKPAAGATFPGGRVQDDLGLEENPFDNDENVSKPPADPEDYAPYEEDLPF